MDLILALAAILGGIAAIWAFGERVINYFDKRNSDSSSAPNFSPIQIIQGTDDEKDLVIIKLVNGYNTVIEKKEY